MRVQRLAASAALLLAATSAAAQAPVVTTRGDPSVRNDTIYALASDSTAFPGKSTLVLLDDGIVKLEADGRATSTYRQVVQILRRDAVENHSEHSFSFVPGRQRMRLNWIRVIDRNGHVISAGPSQVQDSDVPAEMSDPVYMDARVRRVSLSGVDVGTIVDWSYTIEDTRPLPPNDHFGSWSVNMLVAVRRSRLIVEVPQSVQLNIRERNLAFPRQETVAHGRRTYTWAARELARVEPQLYAADSNDVYQSIAYALPRTWADVGHWYAELSRDRYTLNDETRARVASVVAGATTREDSLRALHKWVAQDIRYVSVSLGVGGYRPRTPDEVVATGYGDCKDKATLFVAVARMWGIAAHPVLLQTNGTERGLPSAQQFNHAIAALELPNGGYRFVDLTAGNTPWGELPYGPQGEMGLVVRGDSRVDTVTIPLEPVERNLSRLVIRGALDTAGVFAGTYELTGEHLQQYDLRRAGTTPLDSTQRADAARAIAGEIYPGMAGDQLEIVGGRDLTIVPHLTMRVSGGHAATRAGRTMILSVPLGNFEGMSAHAAQIEAQNPRRFTLSAIGVMGNVRNEVEFRLTLPEGWTAELPQGITANSAFGQFKSEYFLEGRDLVLRRTSQGVRGVYAPERVTELTAWLRDLSRENTRFIVLRPVEVTTAGRPR